MQAIDLVACSLLELFIERLKKFVFDLLGVAAPAADQVMMVAPGDFVDHLPVTDMSRHDQALVVQEIERAIDSGLRQAGDGLLSFFIDL